MVKKFVFTTGMALEEERIALIKDRMASIKRIIDRKLKAAEKITKDKNGLDRFTNVLDLMKMEMKYLNMLGKSAKRADIPQSTYYKGLNTYPEKVKAFEEMVEKLKMKYGNEIENDLVLEARAIIAKHSTDETKL